MNVALLSAGELYGGVEQFLYTYSVHLKKKTGLHPSVLLFNKGRLYEKLHNAKVDTAVMDSGYKYDPRIIYQIASYLKKNDIRLLHTHGYKATIIGGLAAQVAGVRVVKTEHGAVEPFHGLSALKMNLNAFIDHWITVHYVDRVVYITKDLMSSMTFSRSLPNAYVIHNGIPVVASTTRTSSPEKTFNIGIVGRVCPIKGHRVLLDALAKIDSSSLLRLRVHVIGDGPLLDDIKIQTKKMGLSDIVTFHGFKTNVQELMARLDALIMPSFNEGLPYTLLEAMHLKIPIIAANVGGMKEILSHGETALLFEPGHAAHLARCLVTFMDDPSLRARLASQAHKTALSSFTIETMSEKYIQLYSDLIYEKERSNRMIFLSWDRHRRTQELANAFQIRVHVIKRGRLSFLDPAWPLLKTFIHLIVHRYRLVVVQNPSLFLTVAACLLKPFKRYTLVQDLHSYFAWHLDNPLRWRDRIYSRLSKYCIRHCDITIITNEHLKGVIEEHGGRGFILPDKIPNLENTGPIKLKGTFNVAFICTYSDDEPLDEVIAAAKRLENEGIFIYVTGKTPSHFKPDDLPSNVVITGFLSERDYARLLSSADAVLVLTTREHTMLCGAYEGVALSRPLILSDQKVLRDYFHKGTLYVQNNAAAIAAAVLEARERAPELEAEVQSLGNELRQSWAKRFSHLAAIIGAS